MNLEQIKREVNLIEYARDHYTYKCNDNGTGHCLFHPPDNNESFSIFLGQDKIWRWKDHHDGAAGTIVDLKVKMEGITPNDATKNLLEEFKSEVPQTGIERIRANKDDQENEGDKKMETREQGVTKDDFEFIEEYDYTDEEGNLLYAVERRETKRGIDPKEKRFQAKRMVGNEWIYKLNGVKHVLYNLPGIVAAQDVWLVEGEKDANNLKRLGLTATTAPFGKENWNPDFTESLKGKRVFICMDKDEGTKRIEKKRAELIYGAAEEVKIIDLPGLTGEKGKKDITEWLDMQRGLSERDKKEKLLNLVEKTPGFIPPDSIENFSLANRAGALIEFIDARRSGKFFGLEIGCFPRLSEALMGLRGIIVLMAEAKVGKSTFALQIASDIAGQGYGVIYYDFENGTLNLLAREACRALNIKYRELFKAEQSRHIQIKESIQQFKERRNFSIIQDRGLTIDKIWDHISRMKKITGKRETLLIFDSLQKLPMKDLRERRAAIDGWLRAFEELVGEDPYITIFLISEKSRGGLPKESGDIEYTGNFLLELTKAISKEEEEQFGESPRRLTLISARDVKPLANPITYTPDFMYWKFTENP